MDHTNVIILSGHSLFAEAIASRLRQFPQEVEVSVVDVRQLESLVEIASKKPSVVIMDANDLDIMQLCPLRELVFTNPDLRVMSLNSQNEQIQVVSSQLHRVLDADDLIQVIQSGKAEPGEAP